MKAFIEWYEPEEGWHSLEWIPFNLKRYAAAGEDPSHVDAEVDLFLYDMVHNAPKNQSLAELGDFTSVPKDSMVPGGVVYITSLLTGKRKAKVTFVEDMPFEEVPYVPPPSKSKAKPADKKPVVESSTDADELESVFAMLSRRTSTRTS